MDLSLTGFIERRTPEVRRELEQHREFSDLPGPMLAKSGTPTSLDNPNMVAETKWDGTRVLLVKRGTIVRIFVARGNHTEYTNRYPKLIADGKKLKCENCILDGEFVFFDARGDDVFLTIAARDSTIGTKKYKYMAFDILELNGLDTRNLPIEERKRMLDLAIPDSLTIIKESKVVESNKKRFFEQQLALQKEGVMLKKKHSRYVAGRSDDWIKVKRVATYDVIAKGGTKGTGARLPFFGAIHCYLPDRRGQLRSIGDVGSGFTDQDLRAMTPLVRSNQPFVVEVKIMEWTPDKKMRFPVFLRLRTDKSVRDVMESHD